MSSTPNPLPAAPEPPSDSPLSVTEVRAAALRPILNLARPCAASLPVDAGPGAFIGELNASSRPCH
ncbi:MAG: hypothetical protein Q7T63_10495 [Burkholderiaceae bacterium]|nr:hypothetical protein [Burkholderiaceae bacterium]